MQKKKPSFQVIPNYSINGVPNGTNLKKCLRNKAAMMLACAISPAAAGLFCTRSRRRQTFAALSRPG
jgi:hypothetical protein